MICGIFVSVYLPKTTLTNISMCQHALPPSSLVPERGSMLLQYVLNPSVLGPKPLLEVWKGHGLLCANRGLSKGWYLLYPKHGLVQNIYKIIVNISTLSWYRKSCLDKSTTITIQFRCILSFLELMDILFPIFTYS